VSELRSESADDITYDVQVPLRKDTDAITKAIAALNPKTPVEVKWEKERRRTIGACHPRCLGTTGR
jgi:hypothetical protein